MRRRRSLALVATLAIGAFVGQPAGLASAADAVKDLVERYESVAGRHDDTAYTAQREALDALADLGTPAARRAIAKLIEVERGASERALDHRRLVLLLGALVRRGGPEDVDAALKIVEAERDAFVTTSVSRIVASALLPEARAHLRGAAFQKAVPAIKAQIARALGALGEREAVLPLLSALRGDDLEVRAEALVALGELRDESAYAPMAAFLGSADPRLRESAARALGVLGTPRAVPSLVLTLGDPAPRVVESAADALGLLSSPNAVAPLIERLAAVHDKDLRVEEAVERALVRITGKTGLGADPDLWRTWWKENKDKVGPGSPKPEAPTTISGPVYYGFPVRTSRVVFVVDVSRSMGWNGRLETAQKELSQVISHLPASARFNVIAFSDTVDAWADKLVPATPENVKRAARFVEKLAPVNGTNIYGGLFAALKDDDVDTIFFLTDGSPTMGPVVDPDAILAELRDANRWRRVRIHTVALLKGEPPPAYAAQENAVASAEFMKHLAEDNGGSFREVR